MSKSLIFLLFLFTSYSGLCQETQRKTIAGKIIVAQKNNLEGITIYNSTINEGTISNKKGQFQIAVAVGDTLAFSAVQFRALTIVVDQASFNAGKLEVTINVGVNQLPEVVITPYDLSGDLASDIGNIKVEKPNVPGLSSAEIMDLNIDFPDDAQSTVTNSAIEKPAAGGINILYLLNKTVNLVASIFPDKPKKIVYLDVKSPKDKLRNLYDDDFFVQHLKIKKENITKFLYFMDDKGLSSRFLEPGKELELIQHLMQRAKEFKELKAS